MDENKKFFIKQNKRLTGMLIAVLIILLIPLIAMQFTDEVSWTLFDFIVAAILLLGTALMCEFVIRNTTKVKYRIAGCIVLLALLLLIWAELAVGILGTPFGGS